MRKLERADIDIVDSIDHSHGLPGYLGMAVNEFVERGRNPLAIAAFDARKLTGPFRNRYRVDHPILSRHQPERNPVLAVAKDVLHTRMMEAFGIDQEELTDALQSISNQSPSFLLNLRDLAVKSSQDAVFYQAKATKYEDLGLQAKALTTKAGLTRVVWGLVDLP